MITPKKVMTEEQLQLAKQMRLQGIPYSQIEKDFFNMGYRRPNGSPLRMPEIGHQVVTRFPELRVYAVRKKKAYKPRVVVETTSAKLHSNNSINLTDDDRLELIKAVLATNIKDKTKLVAVILNKL